MHLSGNALRGKRAGREGATNTDPALTETRAYKEHRNDG
jgi:hypothetical protein